MTLSETNQRALVVTEANSRMDITKTYENNSEDNQQDNYIKNDEVDELIEWTQCLPTADENLEEN